MATKRRSLATYHGKRTFAATPEPRDSTADRGGVYVVQKHDATRLHYDFRLEHDGALLSWAVPKEPSTDPAVKRLAVRVEDHPVDYAEFEGTIPKGNYGAGTVEIWDRGTWLPDGNVDDGLASGELKFTIIGERLHGKWVLVRMGAASEKENWLLIKERDSEKLSSNPVSWTQKTAPKHQLAELKTSLPQGEGWQFEIKWDGYRVFAHIEDGRCEFISRGGNEIELKDLAKKVLKAFPRTCILDGEIVVLDEKGRSNFSQLQNSLSGDRSQVQFVAFDIIKLEDQDLRELPLSQRRAILDQTWNQVQGAFVSPLVLGSPKSVYQSACELNLEGIVAKRVQSKYSGKRTSDWIKVKCRRSVEANVVGFTLLEGSQDSVGALLLADSKGSYIGRVGTGFSAQVRRDLRLNLKSLEIRGPTVSGLTSIQKKGVFWVRRNLRVLVEFADLTGDGILRQASFQGMANQKPEPPKEKPKTSVRLTSPDRVVDKSSGSTKLDVFEFYEQIAPYLMPQLKDRFVSLLRCPDGADGECFFQKHLMAGKFKGIAEATDGDESYVKVKNGSGLLEAVQMGVIEFHPWGSRLKTIEKPDQLIFDLDPGDGVKWGQVLDGAEFVKQRLETLGLNPFFKLSGGKGVHLVVSIKPELEWADAKSFCKTLAEQLAAEKPKLFISVSTKEKRKGKIYLDYLRNGRGSTAIASYSLRARENLPVAMPVSWKDLQSSTSSAQFTISSALEFLNNRSSDPWAEFSKEAVSLKRILRL